MSKKPPLPPPPPPPRPDPNPDPEPGSKKKFTPIKKLEPSKSKSKFKIMNYISEGLKITHIPEGLVAIGLLIMIGTLFFYNTVNCGYGTCSHNIGLIGQKNNLIIVGGFLFLGGCVLFNSRKD
ncbi:MAG: hypothetical protein F6K24_01915 [Okeania sp. SIO2D1]|nr:hypothetical protein [Microcoleaceae cyanobacterium MO_207.B10]NES64091.1 hypothetical protein [Okeania sp. SIO2D1]